MRLFAVLLAVMAPVTALAAAPPAPPPMVDAAAVEAEMARLMRATGAQGWAVAVVDQGKVVQVHAAGKRNAAGDPLTTDTVMYGASLTKMAFAYMVMQLVDEGVLDLDRPIGEYLERPLPDYPAEKQYAPWPDLKDDPRWRRLTARMLLSHRSGFANFAFLEPDGKLRLHFDPGTRYAYSGEGLILLQFVLERGLGLAVGAEMQRRVFDRFGMTRTSMTWRADFAGNLADGWTQDGRTEPHDERSRVRAAGSMDTTIADMARFAAGYMRGEGLSAKGRAELVRAQWPITTASQFPTLQDELASAQRRRDLAAGLGVVVFQGPQGRGFYKGGHDDAVGNTLVCVARRQRCVVVLGNDVRAEAAFPALVQFVLGDTGVPWTWEYGGKVFVE
ncbi:CubicO group peptidase (beta-lactamase class C family) [Stenotrophomonas sp. 2619]|uniref:serine hydrolase domain-containing protein n=1 Tax=Stenotrophomonas sp. 2619 TaxID=3156316 RepID=UPI003399BE4D